MITDKLSNANLYFGVSSGIKKAFKYLKETDFSNVEPGRYELEENDIFVIVNDYVTKEITEGKPESHKEYIDVQYVADGTELIGYAPLAEQEIIDTYNKENDIIFYDCECSLLKIEAGSFAVFFPGDIHMPGLKSDFKSNVRKVVVKVRVST